MVNSKAELIEALDKKTYPILTYTFMKSLSHYEMCILRQEIARQYGLWIYFDDQ